MGGITKSLWELITTATAGAPADTDLIGVAPQPGTAFTTELKAVTVAQLNTAAAASGTILHARVEVTDAQIIALPTTAVVIVPAVAGRMIFPIMGVLTLDWTADYATIDAASLLDLRSITGSLLLARQAEAVTGLVTTILAPGADAVQPFGFSPTPDTGTLPTQWDGIVLAANNGASGNFTMGDPANVLVVDVLYASLLIP